jgi:hypothetical protein
MCAKTCRIFIIAMAILGVACALLARLDYFQYLQHHRDMISQGITPSGVPGGLSPLDVYHDAVAMNYLHALDESAPDVVFFADSVMGGNSEQEPRTTLAEFLSGLTGRKVLGVSGAGYTALVFRAYANLTRAASHRPGLVIMSINPRSFSGDWSFSPDWSYVRLLDYLTVLSYRPSLPGWLSWLPGRFAGETLRGHIESFYQRQSKAGAAAYFEGHRRDMDAFGPAGPELDEEEKSIRTHFLENYMSASVSDGHPMLDEIHQAASGFRDAGCNVLTYITPVNVQDAQRLAGPLFATLFRADMSAIVENLRRDGIVCVDASEAVDSGHFVDKEYACEHLDLAGRRILAEQLDAALKQSAWRAH